MIIISKWSILSECFFVFVLFFFNLSTLNILGCSLVQMSLPYLPEVCADRLMETPLYLTFSLAAFIILSLTFAILFTIFLMWDCFGSFLRACVLPLIR